MRECGRCEGWIEDSFRFCPWCAAPQRRKLVEFFSASPRIEGDAGKALRVSRYLADRHVRFSIWSEGEAVEAVSLEEAEAERLVGFLTAPSGRERLRRAAARAVSGVRPWTWQKGTPRAQSPATKKTQRPSGRMPARQPR